MVVIFNSSPIEIFHDEFQEKVKESQISNDPIKAIHEFMDFIQRRIPKKTIDSNNQ